MYEVRTTHVFDDWLSGLRDERAAARIAARIAYAARGNLGDVRTVGEQVSELKIDYGQGYRVYFTRRGSALIVLLCGGDKSSQNRDIKRAHKLAKEI